MVLKRRGTAIVESDKGILLTGMSKNGTYLLPGGGAKRKETRFLAAIRELGEETGMRANYAKILFKYSSTYN